MKNMSLFAVNIAFLNTNASSNWASLCCKLGKKTTHFVLNSWNKTNPRPPLPCTNIPLHSHTYFNPQSPWRNLPNFLWWSVCNKHKYITQLPASSASHLHHIQVICIIPKSSASYASGLCIRIEYVNTVFCITPENGVARSQLWGWIRFYKLAILFTGCPCLSVQNFRILREVLTT